MAKLIRVGHSPDPDDAFMFYALAKGKVETGELQFEHVIRDIETLNRWAFEGRLEVTALSLHAYAYVSNTYALLPHGASMGNRYGPIVVAREPLTLQALKTKRIATPGPLTTAFLTLRITIVSFPSSRFLSTRSWTSWPRGSTYHQYRLTKVIDLGDLTKAYAENRLEEKQRAG